MKEQYQLLERRELELKDRIQQLMEQHRRELSKETEDSEGCTDLPEG